MATIKKPKLKRYPKRPAQSASLEVWKRYNDKCNQVEKDNAERMREYYKKVKAKEAAKKQKESIIKKTQGLSGVALGKRSKRK